MFQSYLPLKEKHEQVFFAKYVFLLKLIISGLTHRSWTEHSFDQLFDQLWFKTALQNHKYIYSFIF